MLRDEVVGLLCAHAPGVILDCTVGLGGHAEAMLEAAGPRALLIGMDADESNLAAAKARLSRFTGRVRLFHGNFAHVDEALGEAGVAGVDALLADLGLASTQLDDPERGFSFEADGPLDMRLDRRSGRTAADIVNSLDAEQLADLIYLYSQERYSRRIARAIVSARKGGRIERTRRLAEIVVGAIPAAAARSRRGVHPATRPFMALRAAVNDALGCLEKLLSMLPELLAGGGRAAVISFHSLEDRRVKRAFADLAATGRARLLTKKPITASAEQVRANPRSRSAKLRGMELCDKDDRTEPRL